MITFSMYLRDMCLTQLCAVVKTHYTGCSHLYTSLYVNYASERGQEEEEDDDDNHQNQTELVNVMECWWWSYTRLALSSEMCTEF